MTLPQRRTPLTHAPSTTVTIDGVNFLTVKAAPIRSGGSSQNGTNSAILGVPPIVMPKSPGVHPFFTKLSARKAAAEAAIAINAPILPDNHHNNSPESPEMPSVDRDRYTDDDDSEYSTHRSEDDLLSQLHRMKQELDPHHANPTHGMTEEELEEDRLTRRQQMLRLGMSNSAHFRFLQNMVRQRRGDGATQDEASLGMRFYSIAARVQKTVHFSSAPQPLDYTLFRKNKSQFMRARDHDGAMAMEPFRKNMLLNRMGKLSRKYAEHARKHRYLKKGENVPHLDNRCSSQLTERNRTLLLKVRTKETTLADTNPLNKTRKLKKRSKKSDVFSSPYVPSPRKTLPHEDTPFLKYLHRKQEEINARGRITPSIPSKNNSTVNPFNPAAVDHSTNDQIIEYTQRLLPMPVRAVSEPPLTVEVLDTAQETKYDESSVPVLAKEAPTEPALGEIQHTEEDDANSFFITQPNNAREHVETDEHIVINAPNAEQFPPDESFMDTPVDTPV